MRRLSNKDNKLLEKAIIFLVTEYKKSGHNPKPVILHSLRIAFRLFDQGYKTEIVAGALLHDLLEDSRVTKKKIESHFGKRIVKLVSANTFNFSIKDPETRYKELFKRTGQAGHDALIIKAADLYDNSFYYGLAKDKSIKKMLLNKLEYFLKISKPILGKKQIWKDLVKRFNTEKKLIK